MSPILPNPEFVQETQQIGMLVQCEDLYRNYPAYQRRFRAPMRFRQRLVDSILRGYPIPSLMAYREIGADGVQRYQIIDGKQRLETIFGYVAGDFCTSSTSFDGLKPMHPHKLYRDLPVNAQNQFRSYTVRFQVWLNCAPGTHDDVFRRISEAMPLTKAEKIITFESEANARAEHLATHPWLLQHLSPTIIDRSGAHYAALVLLLQQSAEDRCGSFGGESVLNLARGADGPQAAGANRDLAAAQRSAWAMLDALNTLASSIGYVSMPDIVALSIAVSVLDDLQVPYECFQADGLSAWIVRMREHVNRGDLIAGGSISSGQRSALWYQLQTSGTYQRALRERCGYDFRSLMLGTTVATIIEQL